ncbi:EAL domain-containing protein [Sessilibacter corallicola]|uniref:EAL domain-containing protein n=1 Tax=Sessilibacter corallicola TaxID=2904075 RepID=UPI001E4FBCD0|nr:EAL domain-containing protein [Sessilibacter corallicola]MCE2027429.1 EAL domain-containing protein [Sessilibacter corallicola]
MSRSDTLKLLILNDSRSEVERLVSMLRNAGITARAQHAESLDALSKLLQEQSWDLLLGHDQTSNLPLEQAIREIKKLNKDIPVIAITEEEGSHPVVEWLRAGATEVVTLDDDQHLLLVIDREVENLDHRHSRRIADRKRREAEQKAMHLLDSSRDAIAYVQDGMFLFVNQTFAEQLGYEDKDDLEVMPLIDIIGDDDQGRCKEALKNFNVKSQTVEPVDFKFNAVSDSGDSVPLEITFSQATFDNEPCISLHGDYRRLRALEVPQQAQPAAAAAVAEQPAEKPKESSASKLRDTATGLYNRSALYQQIENALDGSTTEHSTHALLLVNIADFNTRIINTLGYRLSDLGMREISSKIRDWLTGNEFFARFNDSTFAILLPNCPATPAQDRCQNLLEFINDTVFEVKSKTIIVRAQIGISLITETTKDSDQCVEHARKAMEQVRAQDADNDGGFHLFEEKKENKSSGNHLADQLIKAIQSDNIYLLFQPIIGLRGSEEEQYEVLARIRDEEGQDLPNQDLFKEVSDLNTLLKLDRWIVLEAAKQLAQHRSKGNNTRLIVNLSQAVFEDPNLPSWLKVAIKAADLPADGIIFQLREADVTEHISKAKRFTDAVIGNGTPVSITNFGCALNPLNTLKHVNADFIKLDGSYTQELQENPESTGLSNLVRDLNGFKKTTIVPFVENASALSKLWQAGVHYIQGHYLQEPHAQMNYDFNSDN